MDINAATLRELEKDLNAEWNAAFQAAPENPFAALITEYSSNTRSGTYAFFEAVANWQEWTGQLTFDDLASHTYEVVNKSWAKGIKIKREDLEDDTLGIYPNAVRTLVDGYRRLVIDRVMHVLLDGVRAWDGGHLFSIGRTYGSSAIVNRTSAALSVTSFELAMQTMMEYQNHVGQPLYVMPNLLIVGPSLAKTAWDITGNDYVASSSATVENFNSTRGIQVMVTPYLSGNRVIDGSSTAIGGRWFLADTRQPIGPVLFQNRIAPQTEMSGIETIAKTNTIDYMARARFEIAAGVTHCIYGGGIPG